MNNNYVINRDLCTTPKKRQCRHTGVGRYPVLPSTFWIPPLSGFNPTQWGIKTDQARNDRKGYYSKLSNRHSFLFIIFAIVPFYILFSPLWVSEAKAERLDLEETCGLISGKLASVSLEDCLAEGIVSSGSYSVEGIPLLIKQYPPLPHRDPQARVLVVGGTHGDEYSSISVVFRWMEILDIHHSGLFHWVFVPLLNPDGLLRDRSIRTNARGVDLNRNMPSPRWQEVGYQRWLDVADSRPRYYPGPHPMSEPETKFLVDLIHYFKPHAIISVHSPLNLVDYDGPGEPVSDLGPLGLRRLGNFPGTLGNYAGSYMGIPVVTVELASSARMPAPEEISSMWRDLVRWLINTVPLETVPGEIWVEKDDRELEMKFFGK